MEKESNCPNCIKQYSINNPPRLVSKCGHTFCESCILKILKTHTDSLIKYNYSIFKCPKDQTIMTLDDSDINHFPKDMILIK